MENVGRSENTAQRQEDRGRHELKPRKLSVDHRFRELRRERRPKRKVFETEQTE